MSAIKDGGPAFPRPSGNNGLTSAEEHYSSQEQDGMSLRDYFAAKTLNGLLSDADSIAAFREKYGARVPEHLAAACYSFADAMVAEREAVSHATTPELLNAIKGLLGLVQIITFRNDLPPDLAASLKDNHRYKDADALVARIEDLR